MALRTEECGSEVAEEARCAALLQASSSLLGTAGSEHAVVGVVEREAHGHVDLDLEVAVTAHACELAAAVASEVTDGVVDLGPQCVPEGHGEEEALRGGEAEPCH